ncbi:CorA family divalent cation transporter [Micromonosporaceae bacterium Da 78-11]
MDVHLITEQGADRRPVGELAGLLADPAGFVWVDIPCCDDEAVRVLSEVFGFHPLAAAALRETRSVLERIENGRLRPDSPFALSHAVVAALTRNQEEYVEQATADVWHLEQQVTGDTVDNPEAFLNDLFRARHGLLAVRTMGALSGAIYGRMAGLTALPDDAKALVADTADRLTRVRRIADGEREYLQGVIEFYQSILTVKATIVARTQNEKVQRLTEASYAQNEEVKKIS